MAPDVTPTMQTLRSFELPASISPVTVAILAHQNPPDCSRARFLVHNLAHKRNGMGSCIHVMSAMLGYASTTATRGFFFTTTA